MDEKFVREGHDGVRFFIGAEIEHTPAHGKKTLFVVGLESTTLVLKMAREHKVQHVFLSANRSFDSLDLVNGTYMVGDTEASDWAVQVRELLTAGFMVSVDYPAHKHKMALQIFDKFTWNSRNFVPILSVPVPSVSTSNVNLTIKIDDVSFNETNPGVWCLSHQQVTDSNRFTNWNEYGEDQILTEEEIGEPRANPNVKGRGRPVKLKEIPVTPSLEENFDTNTTEMFNDQQIGLDIIDKDLPENKNNTKNWRNNKKTVDAYISGTEPGKK